MPTISSDDDQSVADAASAALGGAGAGITAAGAFAEKDGVVLGLLKLLQIKNTLHDSLLNEGFKCVSRAVVAQKIDGL